MYHVHRKLSKYIKLWSLFVCLSVCPIIAQIICDEHDTSFYVCPNRSEICYGHMSKTNEHRVGSLLRLWLQLLFSETPCTIWKQSKFILLSKIFFIFNLLLKGLQIWFQFCKHYVLTSNKCYSKIWCRKVLQVKSKGIDNSWTVKN